MMASPSEIEAPPPAEMVMPPGVMVMELPLTESVIELGADSVMLSVAFMLCAPVTAIELLIGLPLSGLSLSVTPSTVIDRLP
jgi:hypothetical protein